MLDTLVDTFDDFFKSGRFKDLKQLAREHNLSYSKRQSFGDQSTAIKDFKLFEKKGTKRFIGILSDAAQGFNGLLRSYDYLRTYELETTTMSVIEVFCEDIYTEYFMIQPKGAFGKMKDLFVPSYLLYPHLNQFNSAFEISTKHTDTIPPLNDEALDMVLDFPGITIEGEGNHFFFYYHKKEMKVPNILPTLDFAEQFVGLLSVENSGDYV